MKLSSSGGSIGLNSALCVCFFLVFGALGWGQENPPQKEHPGSQAGSSGKTPEQMGSKGGTETPLQRCDTGTTKKKPDKKKKSKKPDSTKSGDGSVS
jgi:hypothetical protein